MSALVLGILASIAALAMFFAEIAGVSWFSLRVTSTCAFPLWTLVATYAALQLFVWHNQRRRLELSDEEVARWGAMLERVTPDILSMYGERVPVRDIAASLEASHGIPAGVTLRYIIALGRHVREHEHDLRPPT